VRPAHVIGRRPRMSARCASVRESLRNISAADLPRQRLDRRGRQSVRHGAGRRCVGRAPTASGHDHRQAGRDRLIPAGPRVVRTSPRARRPPNQRRPGVPLANPHGANRNAQRETGPARRLPVPFQAQTHEHPDASARRRPPGPLALHRRAAALTAAACVVHSRSLHPTRPEGLDHHDEEPTVRACSWGRSA
jgi:hypothetical protein